MSGEFAYAVDRAVVETCGAVGLGLQADTHVLNGPGNDRVSDAGEGTGKIILTV